MPPFKSTLVTFAGLFIIVLAIPIYLWQEPARLEQSQADLRQQFVDEAALIYAENCALCHGPAGEGIGATPPLNSYAIHTADYDFLYKTIARGRYGTSMTGWHQEEGGPLNDYQIEALVALLRYADWGEVQLLTEAQGMSPVTLPAPDVPEALLAAVADLAPAGSTWATGIQLYADNCTVCHGVNGEGSSLAVPLNTADVRAKEALELARIISEGVPGTLMVGWHNVLTPDDIDAVVAFLQNWDQLTASGVALPTPAPVIVDLNNPLEVAEVGERLFATTCAACHGEEGSGGTGPVLNSQQILTTRSDDQLRSTIINGGTRPNSIMPAFGDRLTTPEIDALVAYLRAWEPTAPSVANPRGTAQGGGPPWLRATPDPNNPVAPSTGQGQGQGQGQGSGNGRGGGPPWRQDNTTTDPTPQSPAGANSTTATLAFQGSVVAVNNNMLTFQTADGMQHDAMLGPPWFWSASGIPLNPGDQIELEGFESTDHLEVNWLTNLTTGQSITLRTPAGQPVWAEQ